MINTVEARILTLNSSDDALISDGINGIEPPVTESCRHQYGFLPCTESVLGNYLLLLLYLALLAAGDFLIGRGRKMIFYFFGYKIGGILFRLSRELPSMMLMIVTGIFSNKEDAQFQVSVAVGVYAGVTVFSLTLLWIMSLAIAHKPLKEGTKKHTEKFRIFIDNGVEVDKRTCQTAGIMLLSLIPYLLAQLVYITSSLSAKSVVTLIALIVSSLSFILYFVYQIYDPWMQEISLDYSKLDMVERRFLQHVEQFGELVKEDGTLNDDVIKGFFGAADRNGDRCITDEELADIMRDKATEAGFDQLMAKLDSDKNKRISEEELREGLQKLVDDASRPTQNENSYSDIDKIMSKILKKAEEQLMAPEALITREGEPNIELIQRLFKKFDSDGDRSLKADELREFISGVEFGKYQMKDDDVIKEIFTAFGQDHSDAIDEDEFVQGMKTYIEKAVKSAHTSERTRIIEEFDKIVWNQEVYGTIKAVLISFVQLILGLGLLTFMSGPLTSTILELSKNNNSPSIIVTSFIVVPSVMNVRVNMEKYRRIIKKERDEAASLTFSEIYAGVTMKNISGLITLLAIVYAKDFTWDFPAEVLTIFVVCGVIGVFAFLNTTYRLFTYIIALLLYLVSCGLLYVLHACFNWN